jgi:membrane-bound lytic murein transglycosylase D
MKILLTYIKNASLLIALVCFIHGETRAQSETESSQTSVTSNDDPISSMLDSLVNLTYIQRINFAAEGTQSANNFQPYEVPTYADDIYRKRIQKIQTPIPLTYNSEVKQYIDMYALRKRALTERVMGLANLYFPLYEQVLDQQGLPLEFKYLSIVESALNPTAVSRVGATGLWQFMLATGKLYNLKVNSFIDERRDPAKATYAACQYFKNMYDIYHDWLLVIAAYNCGAGNVNKAIARSGGKMTFWEISPYLPSETRGYVPAFIAVTYLMNYPSEHNLTAVPPVISYFEADTVMVDQKISLREIADATNLPVELISYLNPIYKKGIIPDGDQSYVLRLPSNKINAYLTNVENIFRSSEAAEASAMIQGDDGLPLDPTTYVSKVIKKYYTVKRGEYISTIANRYNCSAKDLKRWNKLKSTKLHSGQKLMVFVTSRKKVEHQAAVKTIDAVVASSGKPASGSTEKKEDSTITASDVSTENSDSIVSVDHVDSVSGSKTQLAKTKLVYHVVQPGDTLWNIAKRYVGVTVEELKAINQLSSNELKPGTKLKVVIGS